MPKHLAKPLLIDMLHWVEKIHDYTAEMSFDSFSADSKTQDATIRNIQVLGEAAGKIPDSFKKAHPEIEWTKIIRTQHIITREYDNVDYSIIWKIVTVYLPPLNYHWKKF